MVVHPEGKLGLPCCRTSAESLLHWAQCQIAWKTTWTLFLHATSPNRSRTNIDHRTPNHCCHRVRIPHTFWLELYIARHLHQECSPSHHDEKLLPAISSS